VLNIVLTPIMGAMMINGNWAEMFFEVTDPVKNLNIAYWAATAWAVVLTTVFFWWASYRLKNMKY
jgi:hypothetical protein